MQSSGTLGYMLQGVSQQSERVQPDGHVREHINWLPDPNTGLTTRPGCTLQHKFPAIPVTAFTETVRIGDKDYLVVCDEGLVRVYSYDGTVLNVNDTPSLLSYIGRNMVVYATDDEVVLVNKDTPVARDPITVDTDVIRNWGYAFHLGGMFARTYSLTLLYADGTEAVGTYTTPDGTSSGDADKTAAGEIMRRIRINLEAHANFKTSTIIKRRDEQVEILDPNTTFELIAQDGEQNAVFRAGVGEAKTFADVPRYGVHGAVIRVTGEVGSTVDDVWLKYVSDQFTTPGFGFNAGGVWVETSDPDDRLAFDLSTMPHVLTISGTTATLSFGNWLHRRVGNEDTSPVPSFVGLPINDVGEFSNRLWFLAGAFFITSRTNERLDFFRSSAIQVLDTDPVDIRSTGEEKAGLLFGASYDRDLLVFSSTGQFSIAGGAAFSPANASMVRSTNFEMASTVRPVVAGSTVMIPYKNQIYSGMNELKPSLELDSNAVEDLSKVTKRYIEGEIVELVASGNSGIAMCVTEAKPNTLWVYNFLWEENRKMQSAWHKWEFPASIRALHSREGEFFLWQQYNNNLYLYGLRTDKPEDFSLYYHSMLDFKQLVSTTDSKVVLDRPDYAFITDLANSDYPVGITASPESVTAVGDYEWEYTFPEYAPTRFVAGVPFVGTIKPNRPIAMDWRGNKVPQTRVVIGKYVVDYTRSGGIEAVMESPYRGESVVASNDLFPTDDNPLTDFGQALADGSFDVPWGEDNFNSGLILRTNTLQPVTIVEVRWWGQLFKGKN